MKSAKAKTPSITHAEKLSASQRHLTSRSALALIDSLRGEAAKFGYRDSWITHCIAVGDCAGKLAAAIRETQATPLDPDHAKALGLVHDIGKALGPVRDHPLSGYRYFVDHGYAPEYASVCLTHSFIDRECEFLSGVRPADPFLQNYIKTHQNTIYEDLITLCDLYCLDQPLPLESRLINVIIRYGASDRTPRHLQKIYRLKSSIEQQMGKTVEEVLDLPPAVSQPIS